MIDLPARFLVWSRQLSCDIAEKRQAMKRMWPSVASLAKRQIGTWRERPRVAASSPELIHFALLTISI